MSSAPERLAILKALAAAPEPSPELCQRIAARMAQPLLDACIKTPKPTAARRDQAVTA
jgi:hypothetical protein